MIFRPLYSNTRSKAGIRALIPTQIYLAPKPVLVCNDLQNDLSEGAFYWSGTSLHGFRSWAGNSRWTARQHVKYKPKQKKSSLSLTQPEANLSPNLDLKTKLWIPRTPHFSWCIITQSFRMASSPAECWLQPIITLPIPGSCFSPKNAQRCCPQSLLSVLWANTRSLLIWWLGGNAPPICSVYVNPTHNSGSTIKLPSPVPPPPSFSLFSNWKGLTPFQSLDGTFLRVLSHPSLHLSNEDTWPFPRALVPY